MANPAQITALIVDQLSDGEMGQLRLVVAVRKRLGRFEKGDLSESVKSALHKLVASSTVLDVDGMYSLAEK
jgi:hypothetical protein